MSDPFSDRPFPRTALLGAALLVAFALLAASGSRLTGVGVTELPPAQPRHSVELVFSDRDDGAVVVAMATDHQEIGVVAPGTGGFVRGVLRGLGRERKLRDIGPEPPYQLTRWNDGRLSLSDPATGVRIDLEPFGPTNIAAFARFLDAAIQAPTTTNDLSMQSNI